MRLWDWAVRSYARADVERLCLTLQDEHGQCVSYLLWAAWAAGEGRAADPPGLVRAAALARRWEQDVLAPLRAVRRNLAVAEPNVDDDGRLSLRARIKADELAAERLLLESLEALTPAPQVADCDVRAAMRAAAAAWDRAGPAALTDRLAEAFSNA